MRKMAEALVICGGGTVPATFLQINFSPPIYLCLRHKTIIPGISTSSEYVITRPLRYSHSHIFQTVNLITMYYTCHFLFINSRFSFLTLKPGSIIDYLQL